MKKIYIMTIVLAIAALVLFSGCSKQDEQVNAPSTTSTSTVTVNTATPKQAFDGYRKSVSDGDLKAFLSYSVSGIQEEMKAKTGQELTDAQFKQIAAMMNSFMPSAGNIVVANEKIEGSSAYWNVTDKSNPKTTGVVLFVKESSGWKVKSETWKAG